ncbi:S24/S26 family peptidase [Actinophytocola sp.]|uniref:S24/S26 family peptidase n=1 Tax=Actinophytocola sp. TaxID=1872138 RepID=UPI003D6A9008
MRQGLLVLAGLAAGIGAARLALLVIKVEGASMAPTFRSGDTVLTIRRTLRPTVRRGEVVVCRRPDGMPGPYSYLIKRVVAVAGDPVPGDPGGEGETISAGRIYVRGDGERSLDSRAFGAIPVDHVVGHVVVRLAQARAGEPRTHAVAGATPGLRSSSDADTGGG